MKFIPISYCTHGCDWSYGSNGRDGYGSHRSDRSYGCNRPDWSDWPYGCDGRYGSNGCGGYSGFECIFHACGGCGKRRCA